MDLKNDANIRIFWVIYKGAMFGIRMELAALLGHLQVTPWQQSSCSLRATFPVHALVPLHFHKAGLTSKENIYKHL